MPTPPPDPIDTILSAILLAGQLDQLHLSLSALNEMAKEGEIDLILEQSSKSASQKTAYLSKVIEKVSAPELRSVLEAELKKGNFTFFDRLHFGDFLHRLQVQAEKVAVVKLTVAVSFKPADIREMAAMFAQRIGRPVVLDLTIDHSLIGGAIIQHGNYISDYSLRSRLSQFKEEWKAGEEETPDPA